MTGRTLCRFLITGFMWAAVVLPLRAQDRNEDADSALEAEPVHEQDDAESWEELADTDENGYIEPEEFDAAYRSIDVGVAADRPWQQEADADGDDRVSRDEMRTWRLRMQGNDG